MQVENQANQVEKLLQAFQSTDERARETDADAKAKIELLTQQVDQYKQNAEKSNEELRQARKEALEAKQLAMAATQRPAPEPTPRSILRNALASTPKARVAFSQVQIPPDPMSDSDEEMPDPMSDSDEERAAVQEPVPMNKGKGKIIDRG